jgi:hypothetical protein
MGDRNYGIDPQRLKEYAEDVKEITEKGIQVAIVPNREWYAVGIVVHHFYELISDHEVYFRFYIDYRGLCYVAGIVYTPCKSSPCNSKAYNNTGNDTNDFGSSTVFHKFHCLLHQTICYPFNSSMPLLKLAALLYFTLGFTWFAVNIMVHGRGRKRWWLFLLSFLTYTAVWPFMLFMAIRQYREVQQFIKPFSFWRFVLTGQRRYKD